MRQSPSSTTTVTGATPAPAGVEQTMRTFETIERVYFAALQSTPTTATGPSVYASSTAPRK